MKHAYLIMAHEKLHQLEYLLKFLDDYRNDIFLHIDKKVNIENYDFCKICKYSNVFFIKRRSVVWGDFSQIQLEIDLIKSAVNKNCYRYLHLLSGVDMPLKSQDYIHNFFEKYDGKEFVSFDINNTDALYNRCNYYYFFQKYVGRRNESLLAKLNFFFVDVQKKLKLQRIKDKKIFRKGANWFSITDSFAKYILLKEPIIRKKFLYTICCDEVFLQTIMYNSYYYKNRYNEVDSLHANMRLIDWKRGNPYVWTDKDIFELKNTPYLFARKFDIDKSKSIIDKLKKMIDK